MEHNQKASHKPAPFFFTFFPPAPASGFSVKTEVAAEKNPASRNAQFRVVKKLDNSGG